MKKEINTEIGLSIHEYKPNEFYITGYPNAQALGHSYEDAYAFEEAIRRNIDCTDICFDSESCQFWAYAHTEERLIKFANDIKEHYLKAKSMY